MAENDELGRKLRAGIEAAKAGDTATARRLLSEVARADARSELAWIWLAAVLPNPSERKAALKRVLSINPDNARARDALRRLEAAAPLSTPIDSPADLRASQPDAPSGAPSWLFLLLGVALLAVAALVLSALGDGGGLIVPTQVAAVETPTDLPPPTATDTPLPTRTPIPAALITRSAPTLPPTFTYTPTPSLTPTPQYTPTLQLSVFELYYVSLDPAQPQPELHLTSADGEFQSYVAERVRDFAFAPDGFRYAFVRDLTGEDGSVTAAEVFISTLANPDEVEQVTRLGARDTAGPVWSADGQHLIFSSSGGGDNPDLWVMALDERFPRRLTQTPRAEREPALSPDGRRIAYTLEDEGGLFTEIYLADLDIEAAALSNLTQATDAAGSSYNPSWSPDGLLIVFASDRSGDSDIYLMDHEGFNEQVLTLDGRGPEDRAPVFSPDGLWIAYVSNAQEGRFQVYLMTVRGERTRRLTLNPRTDLSVRFKPYDF